MDDHLAAETVSMGSPPFDARRLDAMMDERDLDAVLVTSKHNIQYLLGGYRYFFYSHMDAHGLSRYMPALVYTKGRPELAAYIGSPMEVHERNLGRFWMSDLNFENMTVDQYAASCVRSLLRLGRPIRRLGVETDFLLHGAYRALRDGLPDTEIVDAYVMLELFRAVKSPRELALLRGASEKVVGAIEATFRRHGVGSVKRDIIATLRQEEIDRGLAFEYALVNIGRGFNRAPSDEIWQRGDVLAVDSGGNDRGYIGDLCRMAFPGEPDLELIDLLGFVDEVQQAARKPIRAGARGGDIYAGPDALLAGSPHREHLEFVAHGMGIVSHEAPWLTDRCSVPYAAYHADRELEAGMVISIETTLLHPRRGFIKLEDTVAVTEDGCEGYGDQARGWNRGGA